MKPLAKAIAFVKDNPDRHDQSNFTLTSYARCILSYAATELEYDHFDEESLGNISDDLGIPYGEVYRLYIEFESGDEGRADSIDYAESLLAKYSPAAVVDKDVPVVFEYVVSDAYHRVTLDNEVEAKGYARGLKAAYSSLDHPLDGRYSIKIIKRPVVTSEEVPF
ncbi:MAG TPA: hypothetical protein VGB67_13740 [Fibrella sp.]